MEAERGCDAPKKTEYSRGVAYSVIHVTVFAIYEILLSWKTYKCYYETDELPNPRKN